MGRLGVEDKGTDRGKDKGNHMGTRDIQDRLAPDLGFDLSQSQMYPRIVHTHAEGGQDKDRGNVDKDKGWMQTERTVVLLFLVLNRRILFVRGYWWMHSKQNEPYLSTHCNLDLWSSL